MGGCVSASNMMKHVTFISPWGSSIGTLSRGTTARSTTIPSTAVRLRLPYLLAGSVGVVDGLIHTQPCLLLVSVSQVGTILRLVFQEDKKQRFIRLHLAHRSVQEVRFRAIAATSATLSTMLDACSLLGVNTLVQLGFEGFSATY
eukprot:4560981-Pyramimonas_sp.AAC.1